MTLGILDILKIAKPVMDLINLVQKIIAALKIKWNLRKAQSDPAFAQAEADLDRLYGQAVDDVFIVASAFGKAQSIPAQITRELVKETLDKLDDAVVSAAPRLEDIWGMWANALQPVQIGPPAPEA